MPIKFQQMRRKVQRQFDAVTFLPFAVHLSIFTGRKIVKTDVQCIRAADQLCRRRLAPFRNPQRQSEFSRFDRREFYGDVSGNWIISTDTDSHGVAFVNGNLRLGISIMIYLETIPFCEICERRNHSESARTICIAAVYIHVALLLPFYSPAFKRGIFGNLASVTLH